MANLAQVHLQALYPGGEVRVVYTVSISAYIPGSGERFEAKGTHAKLEGALVDLRAAILEKANTHYAALKRRLAEQNKSAIELAERLRIYGEVIEERKP